MRFTGSVGAEAEVVLRHGLSRGRLSVLVHRITACLMPSPPCGPMTRAVPRARRAVWAGGRPVAFSGVHSSLTAWARCRTGPRCRGRPWGRRRRPCAGPVGREPVLPGRGRFLEPFDGPPPAPLQPSPSAGAIRGGTPSQAGPTAGLDNPPRRQACCRFRRAPLPGPAGRSSIVTTGNSRPHRKCSSW